MKRRVAAVVFLAGLLCLVGSAADLPDKWRAWRYSRVIQRGPATTEAFSEIQIPWEIFQHCGPACSDLRVVDSTGVEVPYVMTENRPTSHAESRAAQVIENSFVENQYTQIVGDLGESTPAYDRIRIETDKPDFIVWAEVALSDDAKSWRIVEPRAPIARFRSRAVDGTQTIPLQGLNARYVRVRIDDPTARFPVLGLGAIQVETAIAVNTTVPATFAEEPCHESGENCWRASLASKNQPVSELRFATDSADFYRAVRISATEDGQEWTYLGSGVAFNYKQGGKIRESLSIEFPEATGRRIIRVEVINGNDHPLANLKLALLAAQRKLILNPAAGSNYRLIYGNDRALAPVYDLGHSLGSQTAKPAYRVLALGAEEVTANYEDPRPFTERHVGILWSALALAIILIGLTAIKAIRTPVQPAPK